MADGLRRSARLPNKITQSKNVSTSADAGMVPSLSAKRKAPELVDPQTQLRNILENPKSILTTTDISELLNVNNWNLIPETSQRELMALLPPRGFIEYAPSPGNLSLDDTGSHSDRSIKVLDPNIFNDIHFLAAAHTFQDHLFSGWFTATHRAKLDKYLIGIQEGTLAAPWKDEVWEQENPRSRASLANSAGSPSSNAATTFGAAGARATAGASADLKLSDLVKNGVLRVGDILAYKRKFSGLGLTVRKDTIIQSTDPLNYTLTVLMPKDATCSLPSSLTCHNPGNSGSENEAFTVSTPHMLETYILDLDGNVKKDQRPNYNAWKSFTVYRWRDGCAVNDTSDQRGGRDVYGTLFYLRGSHYYDQ